LSSRAAPVIVLILVAAFFRALVGPGRRRGLIMQAGTLGGISFGVGVALISHWVKTDGSAICACLGMSLGLAAGWRFARHVPLESN
jgi:hypothetical protein